ncbi:NRT2.5 [Symbiodinium microadriaticum]|nr:NRT2.5 [Symbiodinium microadriaticum]
MKPLFAVLLSWIIFSKALEPTAIQECSHSDDGVAFLQVAVQSAARRGKSGQSCPDPEGLAENFAAAATASGPAADRQKLLDSCQTVRDCVDSADKAAQDAWGKAGAIQAVVSAMRNFPQDKEVMIPCLDAASALILFNRENGLLAGQLGALNLTWPFYSQNMEDPNVTSLGGDIGAFFDYVDENRAIARELGILQGIIQNIRNNFHGQYSDWAFEPIKNSLYALSSGSWTNQDVVVEAGFIPLDVAVVLEHGAEAKIAEESLQVVKALTFYSDEFRHKLSDAGMFKAMAQVLGSRSFDRGAVSLVCETLPFLVGPAVQASGEIVRQIPFDADIQARAGKDGMLEALLSRAMSREDMQHFDHGGFNFNVDAAYPAQQNCYRALQSMAQDCTIAKLQLPVPSSCPCSCLALNPKS